MHQIDSSMQRFISFRALLVVCLLQPVSSFSPPWNYEASRLQAQTLLMSTTTQAFTPPNTVKPPEFSPATGLRNEIYTWKSHQIRYQVSKPSSKSKGIAVLVHGLFVNSDQFRYTLDGLAKAGYTTYAIDLLGYGWSSKPSPSDATSRSLVCGEIQKFELGDDSPESVLKDVVLGTSNGGERVATELELRHPISSPYNFYTWAAQIEDFVKDIVLMDKQNQGSKVTLVANSIGTISSLQTLLDDENRELYNGCMIINPNFRELHSAEVPFSFATMPIVSFLQQTLRERGQALFDFLAKPNTVKEILKEPYVRQEAIDDTLVDVLLTPLLLPGASDVVFDTLSYSAGPLPEQQLQQLDATLDKEEDLPVWICYGDKDPWTPGARVESLSKMEIVERVVQLGPSVGHCPHDEAPELVNPLLIEFMERVNK